ncbi:hypothetical protein STEG23_037084 [Scotinomys teguina]
MLKTSFLQFSFIFFLPAMLLIVEQLLSAAELESPVKEYSWTGIQDPGHAPAVVAGELAAGAMSASVHQRTVWHVDSAVQGRSQDDHDWNPPLCPLADFRP